jgi:hypothetical protein
MGLRSRLVRITELTKEGVSLPGKSELAMAWRQSEEWERIEEIWWARSSAAGTESGDVEKGARMGREALSEAHRSRGSVLVRIMVGRMDGGGRD